MLGEYTITQNGVSNGNVIAQPFTIEVHNMYYRDSPDNSRLDILSCTKNGTGDACKNDDIADSLSFDLPAMGSSKNADLTATFETALTAAYGANWSKN